MSSRNARISHTQNNSLHSNNLTKKSNEHLANQTIKLTDVNTNLTTRLPSALTGSGNLKVCIQELGNEGSERLNVDVGDDITQLPTALTGEGNLKVSIQEDHTQSRYIG